MTDIIITEYIDPEALAILEPDFDIHYDQDLWEKPEELASLMPGVPGMIVRNATQVRGAVLDNADVLKCLGRLGVGLDNIDMDGCSAKDIAVYPAIGANSDSVAELAIGGMFVMLRNAYHATPSVIDGSWPRMQMMGREVMGKTLGIVGLGSIGKALAWRAKGLGMTVIAWDPYIDADNPQWAEHSVGYIATLEELVTLADVVSVHVPLTDETRDMFNAALIAQMKSDALLFNLARGGIVNEADLVKALRENRIGGAFLDTFVVEPVGADNIFKDVPNLILAPHVGARTVEADDRVCTMIANAVAMHLKAEG
jgi:(S)-sulfolactate dehydrogenase